MNIVGLGKLFKERAFRFMGRRAVRIHYRGVLFIAIIAESVHDLSTITDISKASPELNILVVNRLWFCNQWSEVRHLSPNSFDVIKFIILSFRRNIKGVYT